MGRGGQVENGNMASDQFSALFGNRRGVGHHEEVIPPVPLQVLEVGNYALVIHDPENPGVSGSRAHMSMHKLGDGRQEDLVRLELSEAQRIVQMAVEGQGVFVTLGGYDFSEDEMKKILAWLRAHQDLYPEW